MSEPTIESLQAELAVQKVLVASLAANLNRNIALLAANAQRGTRLLTQFQDKVSDLVGYIEAGATLENIKIAVKALKERADQEQKFQEGFEVRPPEPDPEPEPGPEEPTP